MEGLAHDRRKTLIDSARSKARPDWGRSDLFCSPPCSTTRHRAIPPPRSPHQAWQTTHPRLAPDTLITISDVGHSSSTTACYALYVLTMGVHEVIA